MANVNEASINYVADERHVALHHTGNVIFVACWGTAQRGKRATTTNTARWGGPTASEIRWNEAALRGIRQQ